MSYDMAKEELKNVSREQEKINQMIPVDGKRYVLPLKDRDIEVVIYLEQANAPVLFCAYGGGFVLGGCALDNKLWNYLHTSLGVTVISVGYRKTPQYPYPNALHDFYDAIAYIEEHREAYGIDSTDYSVCGNSAGGNLAAAVCILDARRGNQLDIKRQILNYPYCDLYTEPEEKGHPGEELPMYHIFTDYYCGREQAKDPLVSPVFSGKEDLAKLPRAVISVAEDDALRAEGARYICKLRSAGVHVDCYNAAGMPHGYVETYFQGEQDFLSEAVRQLLRDGSMEREALATISFIKDHY
jgi:acetyl esterase